MRTLTSDLEGRFRGLSRLVGNTPLLALDYTFGGEPRRVFAKCESLNMTGSVKDRVALHILRGAYERGTLSPGALIVEATGGNTGISMAALGRALGHPVAVFLPDWMSQERVNLLRSFGAHIYPVSRAEGGAGSTERAAELAGSTPGAFRPHASANRDSWGAHEAGTGPEIHWQLGSHGLRPDAFVAGVGTGGTVMGVGRYLRAHHPDVTIHPLEPSNAPALRTGQRVGRHRIQGIGDAFVPPIVHLPELDDIVDVDDGDAILMAQKLAREVGLGVGPSSGANFLGAVTLQERLGGEAVVVTLFPDSNKKYMSTDLLSEEPVRGDHLSPHVALKGFTTFNRVCQVCDTAVDLLPMAGHVNP